jgi:hypothetical protein
MIRWALDLVKNIWTTKIGRQIGGLSRKAWIKPNNVAPEPRCSGSTFSLLTNFVN